MLVFVALMLVYSAAQRIDKQQPAFSEHQLEQTCGTCHPMDPVREAHLSREDWGLELDKMEVIGAKIKNRRVLLDYLVQHYGVAKRTSRALPAR